MRRQALLGQAARAVVDTSKYPYICRQCLAQTKSRALHSSVARQAEEAEWKKTLRRWIGGKEETEEIKKQDEAQEQRIGKIERGEFEQPEVMKVDGVEYQVAPIVAPRTSARYLQSTTVKDMETIGSKEWLAKKLDQGEGYVSASRPKTVRSKMTPVQWGKLVRHELVQILVLVKNGRPASDIHKASSKQSKMWTTAVRVRVDGNNVELQFPSPTFEQTLLKAVTSQQRLAATHSELQNAPKQLKSDQWHQVPLSNPEIKDALLQRLQLIARIRLDDFRVSRATTAGKLQGDFIQPAPKLLMQAPQVQALSIQLPNVTVHPVRQTYIHKEKAVGRWKIITEELERRGLPVIGAGEPKAKLNSMLEPRKTKKYTRKNTKNRLKLGVKNGVKTDGKKSVKKSVKLKA